MKPNFCFDDFSRECRRRYASVALQSEQRLASLHQACEEVLDCYHPDRFSLLACQAGCGHCCIVNVAVLLPEALAIAEYLESRPEPASEDFAGKLERIWTRIGGVADEERVWMRQSCLFLDKSGSCSIYPVRPLLCRGVTSTAVECCKAALKFGLFAETHSVEMNLFQHELYAAAYAGLGEGLESQGVDGRGFELVGILRYLLHKPQRRSALQSGLRLDWSELI